MALLFQFKKFHTNFSAFSFASTENALCSSCLSALRQLSPSELSRHAVELEKRSMQLSVEEGKLYAKI